MPASETDETHTTTIQITTEVWAALDRRKGLGESFDDVIRDLINATPVSVGDLKVDDPGVEYQDVTPLDADETPEKGCAYYDIISGEECDATPTYKQPYRFVEDDDWSHFYYCDEHVPQGDRV